MGLFTNKPSTLDGSGGGDGGCWLPDVDVVEDEKEYRLMADLSEVKRENLHVSYSAGFVEFHGERVPKDKEGNLIRRRSERSYGKFGRTFRLPENAVGARTRAEFRGGSLLIHVPKIDEAGESIKEIPIGS